MGGKEVVSFIYIHFNLTAFNQYGSSNVPLTWELGPSYGSWVFFFFF